MRNKSYIEMLDKMIEETNARLTELMVTRRVMGELSLVMKNAPLEPEPVEEQPPNEGITIRRVAKPRQVSDEDREKRDAMRKVIENKVNGGEVVTSAELIKEFGLEGASKHRKQHVYQALYDLKSAGVVEREEGTMRYSLKKPPEANHTEH